MENNTSEVVVKAWAFFSVTTLIEIFSGEDQKQTMTDTVLDRSDFTAPVAGP